MSGNQPFHIPQARRDLHSWRYYNEHFKVENQQPLPPYLPPAYRNDDNNKIPTLNINSNQVKKPKSTPVKRDPTLFEQFVDGFDHYCDTSSLHGLKYVGENRFSKPERIFWLIAFLAAMITSIYFISQLFINYNNSPVIVSYSPDLIGVQNIPFPAVTVCNMNVAMKSRAEVIKREGSTVENFIMDDLCQTNSTSDNNDIGSISWTVMERVILNVTQLCSEMIVGCKWQSKTIACHELINSVMTDDGYCCTFNKLPNSYVYKQNVSSNAEYPENIVDWHPQYGYPPGSHDNIYPYRSFGRGVEQGLTLVLNAGLEEYYCSTTSSFGFKIIFHTPRESPKTAELGYMIEPGVEIRMSINAEYDGADEDAIRGIDYNKRKCFFADEKALMFYKLYNARSCLLECESNYTLQKCDCVPYYLPRSSRSKICDKSDQRCMDQAKFVIERFGPDKLACDCLPGCNQVQYFPAAVSQGKLLDLHNITDTEFMGNMTPAYFVDNVAIVHIYYGVDRFQQQVKTAMYGFSEFLSNTGGLLGLFMGFSFLSVVEILYFLFIRSACVFCQNRKKTAKQKQRIFVQ